MDEHCFRRQAPIGRYIVDFVCFGRALVVEVDGGQHAIEIEEERDAARTAWLEREGFRVIRFWNDDVLGNVEGVLEVIRAELARPHPPPQPSPTRGEGVRNRLVESF